MRWPTAGKRAARRQGQRLRLAGLILGLGTVAIVLVAAQHRIARHSESFPAPGKAKLAGLKPRQRIVAIAESQVGYRTDPASSYCNKYTAHWGSGTPDCPAGEASEEWCADFAAWAWQLAGVHFAYGYGQGQINGAAVSFYEWGVRHGTWHPVGSGYWPRPGDVAVYGLNTAILTAVHVAVVADSSPGKADPNVVNGDGDRTAYSVVEQGSRQHFADVKHANGALSGYVSPLPGKRKRSR